MKQCVLMLLATCILVPCAHAGNENRRGHRDKSFQDQTEAQINDIIYDLTVPWPFRKPRGIDTDGDGVVDANDRCPGTPPTVRVGRDGCPISETRTELLDAGGVAFYDIEFDPKEATLKSGSRKTVNEIGQIIEDWPELKVEIGGHTDSLNESAFNQDLSDRRANTVRNYLLDNFDIDPGQLVAVGYGEHRPVASNDTAEGRARNRRVEFKVLNKNELRKTTKTR